MTRCVVYRSAAGWLAVTIASVWALGAPPEGDGFLRGANRIEGFLTWQLASLGIGLIGAIALRLTQAPRGPVLRTLGYGPLIVSSLVALVIAGIVAWAAFSPLPPPAPTDATPPTTVAPSSDPSE